jgi:hypothetical protein
VNRQDLASEQETPNSRGSRQRHPFRGGGSLLFSSPGEAFAGMIGIQNSGTIFGLPPSSRRFEGAPAQQKRPQNLTISKSVAEKMHGVATRQ